MALSITQAITPTGVTYSPIYNNGVYVVKETNSAIYGASNFRFICEIVINTAVIAKLKASIYYSSTNHGVFDVNRIIESYVSSESNHNIIATTNASNSYVSYDVRFGYEYSASPTTTPTEYLNVTSRSGQYAFNAAFQQTDYVIYNENDWLCDDSSAKFLTRIRNRRIYQGQYDFLTFLVNSSNRPNRVKVIAYPSTNTSEFSVPTTGSQRMFYTPSGYNLNNITTLISGTVGAVVPSGTSYYTIQLFETSTARSEVYTYYIDNTCSKYGNNDILFVNRLGGLSVVRLPFKRVDKFQANRNFMMQNPFSYSNSNYWLSNKKGERVQWDNRVSQSITFQSGLINESEVPLYQDMIMSPSIWLISGTDALSLIIEDSEFIEKSFLNDKVIQYTINAKLGFNNVTQRL